MRSLSRLFSAIRRHKGLCASLVIVTASLTAVLAQTAAPAGPAAASSEIHGLDPAAMDTTAKACQDFYRYADGGWLKKNPIPPEYPSWGTFNELAERNREAMHKILERLAKEKAAAGSDEQKLGDFYASCMDEAAVEAQGRQTARRRAREDRQDPEPRGSPRRDRAAPDPRGRRPLRLRLPAGPQELERGHRGRLPGRPGAARPRLLHEDGRQIERAPRPVRRAREENVHASRRRRGARPRRKRRPSSTSRRSSPRSR